MKKDQEVWEAANDKSQTKLQRAIAMAQRYRDYENDDQAAAKVLDAALQMADYADPQLPEALVMRIDLTSHQTEKLREKECREKLSSLDLDNQTMLSLENKHKTLGD